MDSAQWTVVQYILTINQSVLFVTLMLFAIYGDSVCCVVCVSHISSMVFVCVFVVTPLCLLFVTAPTRTDIDSRRVY